MYSFGDSSVALSRAYLVPNARRLPAAIFWAAVLGNAVAIVWLWVHGGNLSVPKTGDLLTSLGRLTGLLGAYSALLQVLLLARILSVCLKTGGQR